MIIKTLFNKVYDIQKVLASDYSTSKKKLKVSDVNTCIDRSLDRNEPKTTRQENLNLNINLSPVDLAEFKRK